jgi:hypothetical protein
MTVVVFIDVQGVLTLGESDGLAHIAQSVEHFLGKEEVTGSNPVMSSSTARCSGSPNIEYSRTFWLRRLNGNVQREV